ncbi:MAG TPA: YjbH domain-containing protein [Armatimonadota bacterium]|jgi:hypothetical protein
MTLADRARTLHHLLRSPGCAAAVAAAVALLSLATPAGAYRIIDVPTGQVLGVGQLRLEYKRVEDQDRNAYRADVGLPFGIELQASYSKLGRGEDPSIGAQWSFLRGTALTPAVSVGVQDTGLHSRGSTTAYVVAGMEVGGGTPVVRKYLPHLRVNAGIGTGLLRGVFAGAQLSLSSSLQVYVEHDSRSVNGGVAWSPAPRVSLKLEEVWGKPAYGVAFNVGL